MNSNTKPVAIVKAVSYGASSFLLADMVAKKLPPTAAYMLGWGAIATSLSYLAAKKFSSKESIGNAVAIGVAGAYLHAYAHETSYKKRELK